MGEVLDIRNLRVNVEGKEILKGVNLTVEQGEVHALMAPTDRARAHWHTASWGIPATMWSAAR